MNELPKNWQLIDAEKGGNILFSLYEVSSFEDAYLKLNSVYDTIYESGLTQHISIDLNSDYITITLNALGELPDLTEFYTLAKKLDGLLIS